METEYQHQTPEEGPGSRNQANYFKKSQNSSIFILSSFAVHARIIGPLYPWTQVSGSSSKGVFKVILLPILLPVLMGMLVATVLVMVMGAALLGILASALASAGVSMASAYRRMRAQSREEVTPELTAIPQTACVQVEGDWPEAA